jgi:hypothetical protein
LWECLVCQSPRHGPDPWEGDQLCNTLTNVECGWPNCWLILVAHENIDGQYRVRYYLGRSTQNPVIPGG